MALRLGARHRPQGISGSPTARPGPTATRQHRKPIELAEGTRAGQVPHRGSTLPLRPVQHGPGPDTAGWVLPSRRRRPPPGDGVQRGPQPTRLRRAARHRAVPRDVPDRPDRYSRRGRRVRRHPARPGTRRREGLRRQKSPLGPGADPGTLRLHRIRPGAMVHPRPVALHPVVAGRRTPDRAIRPGHPPAGGTPCPAARRQRPRTPRVRSPRTHHGADVAAALGRPHRRTGHGPGGNPGARGQPACLETGPVAPQPRRHQRRRPGQSPRTGRRPARARRAGLGPEGCAAWPGRRPGPLRQGRPRASRRRAGRRTPAGHARRVHRHHGAGRR